MISWVHGDLLAEARFRFCRTGSKLSGRSFLGNDDGNFAARTPLKSSTCCAGKSKTYVYLPNPLISDVFVEKVCLHGSEYSTSRKILREFVWWKPRMVASAVSAPSAKEVSLIRMVYCFSPLISVFTDKDALRSRSPIVL